MFKYRLNSSHSFFCWFSLFPKLFKFFYVIGFYYLKKFCFNFGIEKWSIFELIGLSSFLYVIFYKAISAFVLLVKCFLSLKIYILSFNIFNKFIKANYRYYYICKYKFILINAKDFLVLKNAMFFKLFKK